MGRGQGIGKSGKCKLTKRQTETGRRPAIRPLFRKLLNGYGAVFLAVVQILACCSAANAEVTRTWTINGSSGTTAVLGVRVQQSGVLDGNAYRNSTFATGNHWDTRFGAVSGGPSLGMVTSQDPNAVRSVTVTFSKPVDNPILHVDELGGYAFTNPDPPTSNSSVWQLVGANTQGGSVELVRLSGNPALTVNSAANAFGRAPGVRNVAQTEYCRTDGLGSACGSIQFVGRGITSLTFRVTFEGKTYQNDARDFVQMRWSFAGSDIEIRKESIGATGTYAFAADQGIGAFNLDTSQNNPANSAQYPLQDNSQPITITETLPPGTRLETRCVDQYGNIVPSAQNDGTLTIAASDYGANQKLVCTFTNTRQPSVQVGKISEGGTGTFNFTGDNGIAAHAVTTAAEGVEADGPVQLLSEPGAVTTLTEVDPGDFALSDVYCDGLGQGGRYTVAGRSVRFDEAATAAGAAIKCIFTNIRKLPQIEVRKTVDQERISAPATLSYTITLRNTGEGPASNVILADIMPDGSEGAVSGPTGDANGNGLLDVGEIWSYEASYAASQDDIDAGNALVNRVEVKSSEIAGPLTAEAKTDIARSSAISVTKRVDKAETSAVDDVLSYSIRVENTGNVSQTNLVLADVMPDGTSGSLTFAGGDENENGKLDIDEVWLYTATYTVNRADLEAGSDLINTVKVSSDQIGEPIEAHATTEIHQDRSLTLSKVVDKRTTGAAGEVLTYTITARNTGNVALADVQVTDTLPGGAAADLTGPAGDDNGNDLLDVDEQWVWTTTYTVTQSDIDAGNDLVNTAGATATGIPAPVADDATTGVSTKPGIQIEKDVDRDSISRPGSLDYTITVTNTGNVSLDDVVVTDTFPDGTSAGLTAPSGDDNNNGQLDVGEIWVYRTTFAVTQSHIDAGTSIDNTAAVTATDPSGQIVGDTDVARTAINRMPRLNVAKDVDKTRITAPGTLTYTVRATNTGNVALEDVSLDDVLSNGGAVVIGAPVETGGDGSAVVMEAGATWTWRVTYEATQADIENGAILTNVATVSGRLPGADPAEPRVQASDDAGTAIEQQPSLTIEKSVDKATTRRAGDVLTYTIRVENNGNVALRDIAVSDTLPDGRAAELTGPAGDGAATGVLDAGKVWTWTTTYTVTQTALDEGAPLVNSAAVTSDRAAPKTDTASTSVVQDADLAISKMQTSGPNPASRQGQVLGYTITVRNTGNVSLTGVRLSDILPDGTAAVLNGPDGDVNGNSILDVGETWSWTASYSASQADIDTGRQLLNRARVSTDQITAPRESSASTPVAGHPELQLSKRAGDIVDANDSGRVDAGDTITYTFTVTNSGTVSVRNLLVDDARLGLRGAPVTPSALAPGETGTASGVYTLTQADIDAGLVNNTAVARGEDAAGADISGSDTVSTRIDAPASLSLTKTAGTIEDANANGMTDAGDTITYRFSVENTGSVSLRNVIVNDDRLGLFNLPVTPSSLAPGDTGSAEATYELVQADIDAGTVENTAEAIGLSPRGIQASDRDGVVTPVASPAALSLAKVAGAIEDANGNGMTDAGDTITYSFEVENTGGVTLTDVTVSDPKLGVTGLAVRPPTLAPGQKGKATATYTLVQGDLDAGQVENSASANGRTPSGVTVNGDDTITTPVEGTPGITVRKRVDSTRISAPGALTYTVVATNTGSVPLSNVELRDTLSNNGAVDIGAPVEAGGDGTTIVMEVGAAWTWEVVYQATQADIDAGQALVNTVVVSAQAPSHASVSASGDARTLVERSPSLSVSKTVDKTLVHEAGEVLSYTITVTNTGNVSQSDVALSDIMPDGGAGALTGPSGDDGNGMLDVGEVWTYTASYTVRQADMESGSDLANRVMVSSGQVGTAVEADATTEVSQNRSLSIDKVVDKRTTDTEGDVLNYTITARNTGNVALAHVSITDTLPDGTTAAGLAGPSGDTNGNGLLDVDETWIWTTSYRVTQADIDAGNDLVNKVSASADGIGVPVADDATTGISTRPGIHIEKDVDRDSISRPGPLNYTITVTNTGNVTLDNVALTDTLPDGSAGSLVGPDGDDGNGALDPGEVWTYAITYAVVQDNIDRGSDLVNSVIVTASDPSGNRTDSDSAVTTVNRMARIDVTKTVDKSRVSAPGTLAYTVRATNTGNVTLENVTLNDVLSNGGTPAVGTPVETGGDGTTVAMEVGATWTWDVTYDVTQADVDAGVPLVNTATVSAEGPDGTPAQAQDTVRTTMEQQPSLSIDKTVDKATARRAGDVLNYTIRVENTGNVALTGIVLTDTPPDGGPAGLTGPDGDGAATGVLGVGKVWTWTATYTVTQADIDAGATLVNTAAVTSDQAGPATDTASTLVARDPDLVISKTQTSGPEPASREGESLGYTITVRNTGNVTQTGIDLADVLPDGSAAVLTGPAGDDGNGLLDVGETWSWTTDYTVSQSDIDAGRPLVNTAQVKTDQVTTPRKDTAVTDVAVANGMTLTKTAGSIVDANGNGRTDAGDTITYTFSVENTGTVTLSSVKVTDTKLGLTGLAVTPATLAPGETGTASATYTLKQADMDAGKVDNTATASATVPGQFVITDRDTVSTPLAGEPAIALTKSAGAVRDTNGNGLTDVGDTITYTFTVENTGTVSLADIAVDDPKLVIMGMTVSPANLAPGEMGTATADYRLTQADIDAGQVVNTATARGYDPQGVEVTKNASAIVAIDRASGLALTKTAGAVSDANGTGRVDAGDTITYTFSVENIGTVTLTNVTIADPKIGARALQVDPPNLRPGRTGTATATYTLTQADIDAGKVENTATAAGEYPGGRVTADDTVITPVAGTPALTVVKTAGTPSGQTVGSIIVYSFEVTNTGSVSLTGVTVSDPMLGSTPLAVAPADLGPGEKGTATATYTLTQEDLNRGEIVNTARSAGMPVTGGDRVESGDSTVTTPLSPRAALNVIKTAGQPSGNVVGSTIDYSFTVTNTGDVDIENITLADRLDGVAVTGGPIALLKPNQSDSTTFSARYTISQADIDAGEVVNAARVTGTPASGGGPVESDDSTVTTPIKQSPRIELAKGGQIADVDGNGVIEAGDTIVYSFAVSNTGNVAVFDVQPVDQGPSFNGVRGTNRLGAFNPGRATIAPGRTQVFTSTYTLSQADIDNAAGLAGGVSNTATARGYYNDGTPTRAQVETDPSSATLDLPAAAPSDIEITKQAGLRQIRRGEEAPFTIKVINKAGRAVAGFDVVDRLPPGFRFVKGSATVDGAAATPQVNGAKVVFANLTLPAHGEMIIRLRMLALGTAGPGRHINRAGVTDLAGNRLAPEATAAVEIVAEPVFDCGDIVGKVFDDRNGNGYQDKGEPGLPGVRVATVNGLLVTTDQHGRFHVACAMLPDARIGSNFIMKLDERTLPTGYRVTTENPRVVRLTAGKMTTLNFGAALGRVVRLDLADEAFLPGQARLKPEWDGGIDRLLGVLREQRSTLHIHYLTDDPALGAKRLEAVRDVIDGRWKTSGAGYRLSIEMRMETRR